MSEPRWIVIEYDARRGDITDCAIVPAPDEKTAAERGAEWLYDFATDRADARDFPIEPPRNVFVAPWDGRTAYTVELSAQAEVASLQCCGGGTGREPAGLEGHWAGCPNVPEREEFTPEAPPGTWLTWCWEGRKRVCDDCGAEVLPSDGGYYTCSGCGRVGSEDES